MKGKVDMKEYETTRAHQFYLYEEDWEYIISKTLDMADGTNTVTSSDALRKIIREHRSWAEGLKRIAQDGNGETN